ncbi:MAG: hypothetical protein N4J56_002912 [Chroococcidiopsis sp. SAG 2025]|nr:hypothetical protein [Chroococcidiopsis sp. SAG 2025]
MLLLLFTPIEKELKELQIFIQIGWGYFAIGIKLYGLIGKVD